METGERNRFGLQAACVGRREARRVTRAPGGEARRGASRRLQAARGRDPGGAVDGDDACRSFAAHTNRGVEVRGVLVA